MNNYGDIIKRMEDLIILSSQKYNALNNAEDRKNNFVKMFNYNIYIDYVKEFQMLLGIENTFYFLKNKTNLEAKNNELIEICKNNLGGPNGQYYNLIMNMLIDVKGKKAHQILEYDGYYVAINNYDYFISLCKKLGIGPGRMISDFSKDEGKKYIQKSFENRKEQMARINKILDERKKIIDYVEPGLLIDSEFRDMIYLGINGNLSFEIVRSLQKFYSKEKFRALLGALEKWQIFNNNELNILRSQIDVKIDVVSGVEDLVAFFSQKEGVDVDALKILIPDIGIQNYNYLIYELNRLGTINLENKVEPEVNMGGRK